MAALQWKKSAHHADLHNAGFIFGLSLDDSCIVNIFLLLGLWNIGCLDANQVSWEDRGKMFKQEKPKAER
ncbi:hypothetical protein OUZ56_019659 [Daphnia magna]|uniref:Uncharacterized protein n=1 Tax=Daphnia magna TaxID=35525 RepID=A0ABQ9ZC78_9CRUS|nr:hypothetical protein OUZ56_019659 [Daphnia magna]